MSTNNYEEDKIKLLILRGIPKFNSCFCMTLRTAALVIAYVNSIALSLFFFLILYDTVSTLYKMPNPRYIRGYIGSLLNYTIFTQLFMSFVLLAGLYKMNKGYVLAWLLVKEVDILEHIVTVTMSIIFSHMFGVYVEDFIYIIIASVELILIYRYQQIME